MSVNDAVPPSWISDFQFHLTILNVAALENSTQTKTATRLEIVHGAEPEIHL